MRSFLSLVACLFALNAAAQSPYAQVQGYWKTAGYRGTPPSFSQTRNILDFGADPGGTRSCNAALAQAITALDGRAGTIEFPAGQYFFDAPISLERDSILLRGAGHDSTRLRFDLGGQLRNLINISGQSGTDTSLLSSAFLRGDSVITITNPEAFRSGDWITLSIDDAAYMSSSWAQGTLAQIAQIRSINGNRIVLDGRARFNYMLPLRPRIRKMIPRNNIGLECLALERLDATAGQTSNIAFDRAVNCWLSGIESDKANFAHAELNRSSNISIRNSWFHDAFAYGGGGQGYGVLLQMSSNECSVSGNYFRHLRHSMLLQSGANGNVLSYNYSTKPYWTETGLPDSSAGEIVLHGDYPFMNLAEGNVVQNIVIDDSHGKNGPLNTFFRNRATGYGIFMNFMKPTDSALFIGNEVTNAATGLYFISGNGHVQFANNHKGAIVGTPGRIAERSLYLPADTRPDCSEGLTWPAIGEAAQFNTGGIPVMARVAAGKPASCGCYVSPAPTSIGTSAGIKGWRLAPNPAQHEVRILGDTPQQVQVFDATGRLVLQLSNPSGGRIGLASLPAGLYNLRVRGAMETGTYRLLIQR